MKYIINSYATNRVYRNLLPSINTGKQLLGKGYDSRDFVGNREEKKSKSTRLNNTTELIEMNLERLQRATDSRWKRTLHSATGQLSERGKASKQLDRTGQLSMHVIRYDH